MTARFSSIQRNTRGHRPRLQFGNCNFSKLSPTLNCSSCCLVFLLRIDRQKDAIAEGGFQPLNGAILVAARTGAAANADGADHLAVDNDGKTAGVREESELHQLPRLSAGVVAQLCRADRG